MKIKVWRLEHEHTCLGPFCHGGQISEMVLKGIHTSESVMCNLDINEEVERLISYCQPKFAYASKENFDKMIKDRRIINKHGFVGRIYEVIPLYVHPVDNQVIYSEYSLIETFKL